MTNKKIKVGILFGGRSAEHEVSLQSARNVVDAIDRELYDPLLIAIEKSGAWRLPDQCEFLRNADDPKRIELNVDDAKPVALVPHGGGDLSDLSRGGLCSTVDVVLPILHGPFGEDGTIQGLLKLAGVPFVGSSVLGSAVGMDKDVMKRLMREAGLPIGKYLVARPDDWPDFDDVAGELGLPVFIKPANLGSSVGVHKVTGRDEFKGALEDALRYDTKVLIEEFIDGREVECAVLGDRNPISSVVGEIVPSHAFYSYDAKYIDDEGAALEIPADIPSKARDELQHLAVRTFQVLECEGLGRVDFFLKPDGALIVNEINTMPGFTKISMYPRLWEASDLSYTDLITRLIELAFARHDREKSLITSF